MIIYIDKDYKCHTAPAQGLEAVETGFFDGKAPGYISGYRFVPEGRKWVRADGAVFDGEMVCPWKDWAALDGIQRAYETEQLAALTAQNNELVAAMAAMVEDIYNQDIAEIEGE